MINIIDEKDVKVNRMLRIYSKLVHAEIVNKREMSERFNVSEKTIQKDLVNMLIREDILAITKKYLKAEPFVRSN